MGRSTQSLKAVNQSSTVVSDEAGRPRYEMLYEDSKIRIERHRKRLEENPPKAAEPFSLDPGLGGSSFSLDPYDSASFGGGGGGGGGGLDASLSLRYDRSQQQNGGRFNHGRKYDVDRTDALYQDAQRRHESLLRRQANEARAASKTFKPDLRQTHKRHPLSP